MKKNLLFLYSFLLHIPLIFAQTTFTPLSLGPVVTTPADSRSVNIIDVDGDGWDDLFISNGLKGGQKDMLYLNDQQGNFTVLTAQAIVEDEGASVGASAADFDNDGDVDIYVTNWYGEFNKLYRNDGAGNFTEASSITTATTTYSETASWGDFDQDGLLDLLVTNSDGNPTANALYRNRGSEDFQKINSTPLTTSNNISRNVNWVDYDNDGDVDLYITNEGGAKNELYNNTNGNFTRVIDDVLINGAFFTMTSSWGDVDNDGDLDLFLGNSGFFAERKNYLFRNAGDGTFENVVEGDITTANGCNFGSAFGDVDNDGDLDLLVTSGFCQAEKLQDVLYLNDGTGRFTRDEEWLAQNENIASYGAAMGDLNQDGFLDLVIAHCKNATASPEPVNEVWYNEGNDNHWLQIQLEGSLSNRSALGARVTLRYQIDGQEVQQIRELNAQSGYAGQNSRILHFGLGPNTEVVEVYVQWPSGNTSSLLQQTADQKIIIEEQSNALSENLAAIYQDRAAVYPNPLSLSSTSLQIQFYEQTPTPLVEWTLYAADGKKIWTDSISNQIDTHTLQWPQALSLPGTYHLVLRANGQLWFSQALLIKP